MVHEGGDSRDWRNDGLLLEIRERNQDEVEILGDNIKDDQSQKEENGYEGQGTEVEGSGDVEEEEEAVLE